MQKDENLTRVKDSKVEQGKFSAAVASAARPRRNKKQKTLFGKGSLQGN